MEQERLQELTLAQVARIAEKVVEIQGKISRLSERQQRLNHCMANMGLCIENEIINKLKAVFTAVDGSDQRSSKRKGPYS